LTRQLSSTFIKGRGAGKGSHGQFNVSGKPREGTRLRAAYDALRRGEILNLSTPEFSGMRSQLQDFYGMDIISVPAERGHGVYLGSRLRGEWEGDEYVPIERIVAGVE
jgi:hypothetical protein